MKKVLYILWTFIIFLTSCSEDSIMDYEGGGGYYFVSRSKQYSFLQKLDSKSDTILVEVHINGTIEDYDREIGYNIVRDTVTDAPENSYNILDAKIYANDTSGYIIVEVLNQNFLDTDEDIYNLYIELTENEHFIPGGFSNYYKFHLTWTTQIVQPATWSAFRTFCCATYSTSCYLAIIEATGLYELYYSVNDPETGTRKSMWECYGIGKQFGDWIRNYNETHDDVYRHDDGDLAGQPVTPRY